MLVSGAGGDRPRRRLRQAPARRVQPAARGLGHRLVVRRDRPDAHHAVLRHEDPALHGASTGSPRPRWPRSPSKAFAQRRAQPQRLAAQAAQRGRGAGLARWSTTRLTQYMFCSPGEGAVALVLARGPRIRRARPARRSTCARSPSARGASAPSRCSARRSRSSRRRRRRPRRRRRRSSRPASGPSDVDVAQVQDTESGAEVMHMAETGLCEHGEQEVLIQSGATDDRRPAADQHRRRLPRQRRADRRVRPAPGARGRPAAARRRRRPAGPRPAPRRLHAGLRRAGRQRLRRAHGLRRESDAGLPAGRVAAGARAARRRGPRAGARRGPDQGRRRRGLPLRPARHGVAGGDAAVRAAVHARPRERRLDRGRRRRA